MTGIDTQDKIREITSAMQELLLEKNKRYGDSALKPSNTFSKLDAKSSILIRLDDKLNRVKNSTELRINDISDLIGYEVLLLIAMGCNKQDIIDLID